MQFLVLVVGILVFVFFLFQAPPIHFNSANLDKLRSSEYAPELAELERSYSAINEDNTVATLSMVEALRTNDEALINRARTQVQQTLEERRILAADVDTLLTRYDPELITEDRDYVFITFVINYLAHRTGGVYSWPSYFPPRCRVPVPSSMRWRPPV